MVASNGAVVHQALASFQEAREGARRFHDEMIGHDVDPDHCFADWLALARNNDRPAIEKKYWSKVAKSALAETSGTTGGYTVPPGLSLGLMRDLSTGSLFRRLGAYVHPMQTLRERLPLPDVSTAQAAGTAPYYGGFLMKWLAEAKTFPATGVQFRDVELTAWELGGYVYASRPFLQDAAGVEAWLTRLFGNGAAYYQDLAFFQGDGIGKPQGVINSGAAVTVTRMTSGQVKSSDVQTMISKMLPSAYEDGLVWFCHPTVLAQFSNTNFPGWVANYDLQMYGRPIIPTGKCATLGSKGDLILVAPSLYVIGDRMEFQVVYAAEEPTAWKNNQGAFRILSRVDGRTALATPITLQDGTSTTSPYVVLV